jgi:hypothetical protein
MNAARYAWRFQQMLLLEKSGAINFDELDRLERLTWGKPRRGDYIDRDAEEDNLNSPNGGW